VLGLWFLTRRSENSALGVGWGVMVAIGQNGGAV
jgi:hypothetical protein